MTGKGYPRPDPIEVAATPSRPGLASRAKGKALRARLYAIRQTCYWCEIPLSYDECTVEHLVRRADGGKNTMENCTIACGPCNWARGTESDPAKVVALGLSWRLRRGERLRCPSPPKPRPVPLPEHADRYERSRAAFLEAVATMTV